jgi:tryprostatin B 6-hydroxylase
MEWGFYFLAKDPMLRAKLREELEPIMRGAQGGDPPYSELAHASLLNAVINETIRVKTSVPNGGPRITPPEGLQVGDTWIPGEVTIFTPHHIIQHSKLRRPYHSTSKVSEYWLTPRNRREIFSKAKRIHS